MSERRCENACDSMEDDSIGLSAIIKSLKLKWPNVPTITTKSLYNLQHISGTVDKPKTYILDVRSPEEFSVSHLKDAIQVDINDRNATANIWKTIKMYLSENKPVCVVCYCSVGYRSSKYADVLHKLVGKEAPLMLNHIQIFNLEGSIFKWANEGKPIVDNSDKSTVYCHPFSSIWGKLLIKSLRQWSESSQEPRLPTKSK